MILMSTRRCVGPGPAAASGRSSLCMVMELCWCSLYRLLHGSEVRKMPSWPRSWANFSLLQLYSHINSCANLHCLGQPNTFLGGGAARARAEAGDGARRLPRDAAHAAAGRRVIQMPLSIFYL